MADDQNHHEHHDHTGGPDHEHTPEHETHELSEHGHSHESGGAQHSRHEGHTHHHEHAPMSPEEYATALREAKDAYMRDDSSSPIAREARSMFAGLKYYPYNAELALEMPLDRNVSTEKVQMGTSTGDSQEHVRAGKIHFEIRGEAVELTLFGTTENLFLPLRDSTSGKETYGAGRYIEPEMTNDDTVFVDFNLLYNPYCAYNEAFSCPLPPIENWLKVPIEAGERAFK